MDWIWWGASALTNWLLWMYGGRDNDWTDFNSLLVATWCVCFWLDAIKKR
jgi:hypothetical protein